MEVRMARNIEAVLLGLGLTIFAIATLIRDSTTPDASIEANGLAHIGIPVGTLSLAKISAHKGYADWWHHIGRLTSH